MTRIFYRFFMWKMDPISGFDIRLVFTLPPKDSKLQYKRCVHFWKNFPCLTILGLDQSDVHYSSHLSFTPRIPSSLSTVYPNLSPSPAKPLYSHLLFDPVIYYALLQPAQHMKLWQIVSIGILFIPRAWIVLIPNWLMVSPLYCVKTNS